MHIYSTCCAQHVALTDNGHKPVIQQLSGNIEYLWYDCNWYTCTYMQTDLLFRPCSWRWPNPPRRTQLAMHLYLCDTANTCRQSNASLVGCDPKAIERLTAARIGRLGEYKDFPSVEAENKYPLAFEFVEIMEITQNRASRLLSSDLSKIDTYSVNRTFHVRSCTDRIVLAVGVESLMYRRGALCGMIQPPAARRGAVRSFRPLVSPRLVVEIRIIEYKTRELHEIKWLWPQYRVGFLAEIEASKRQKEMLAF